MLTYTTIFIASMVLAVIALVFYRVVMQSSKSILSAKGPVSINSTPGSQKSTAPFTTTGTSALTSQKSHLTPAREAATHPAMPSEKIDWGWKTGGTHVREQRQLHATGGGNTGHCSLYNDLNPAASSNQRAGRLHREDKREAYGKAYKVTRRVSTQSSNLDESGQPWGW